MKSTAKANADLDAYYGSGTPATLYIGLFTSAPAADGSGGTEVSGGSYARVAVTNNATNWPAASAKSKANGVAITFAAASALWGTVVAAGVFTASSGGDPDEFQDLVTSRTINSADVFEFAIGQFVISET